MVIDGQKSSEKTLRLYMQCFRSLQLEENFIKVIMTEEGSYTFHLNGHNHHRIGSLFPTHDDGRPRFAHLYIYDTENEIEDHFYT